MGMTAGQLMAYLHSIHIGAMDGIQAKIDTAREACVELDQLDLAQTLDEAGAALDRADLKTYRKRLETAISRLGHVR